MSDCRRSVFAARAPRRPMPRKSAAAASGFARVLGTDLPITSTFFSRRRLPPTKPRGTIARVMGEKHRISLAIRRQADSQAER
jgi:hypothetical protein